MTLNAGLSNKTPEILYEDNHLLVAVKPPGVLSQADGSQAPDMLTLLKKYLKDKYQKPGQVFLGLVHRLDRPAGGVMIFARTSKAAARLSQQIRDHQAAKTYLAVIDGVPDHAAGIWRDNLVKDTKTNQVHVNQADQGKEAWLSYKTCQTVTKEQVFQDRIAKEADAAGKPVFSQPFLSLVAVRLGSGRGHQIRVQLASRDLPILGDRKYHPDFVQAARHNTGGKKNKKQALYFSDSHQLKNQDDISIKVMVQAVSTVCLWSVCIGFYHPISRQWLTFTAWPPDTIPWRAFSHPDMSLLTDWQIE